MEEQFGEISSGKVSLPEKRDRRQNTWYTH